MRSYVLESPELIAGFASLAWTLQNNTLRAVNEAREEINRNAWEARFKLTGPELPASVVGARWAANAIAAFARCGR